MPYDKEIGLSIHGSGKSNRNVILKEIKEARQEVQKLAQTLTKLEAMVLGQPDTGLVKIEKIMTKPILTNHDLKPLLGWILSLYESFYIIGHAAVGSTYAKNTATWFSSNVTTK